MQILFIFFLFKYYLYICFMISTTTIRLNDKIKEAGQKKASKNAVRGGFSAYIESLIKADLSKDGVKFDKP